MGKNQGSKGALADPSRLQPRDKDQRVFELKKVLPAGSESLVEMAIFCQVAILRGRFAASA
jgi:hypothetical protein